MRQRATGKAQQEQQRCDHHHSGEIGKNVQAGSGRPEAGVDLFHQDHTVGSGTGQRTEAHQEELMFKTLEAGLDICLETLFLFDEKGLEV